jgi:hypothetical protein
MRAGFQQLNNCQPVNSKVIPKTAIHLISIFPLISQYSIGYRAQSDPAFLCITLRVPTGAVISGQINIVREAGFDHSVGFVKADIRIQ